MLLLCFLPHVSCVYLWSLQKGVVCPSMDGDKSKGKRLSAQSDTHDRVSRAQHQALCESHIYELELSQEIHNIIVETKKSLWKEFDSQKLKDECKKVED